MENTSNPIIYAVNSDLDDGLLYAEFENKDAAIEYAKQHLDKLPFVDELEVSYDANGEIDNVFSYKTIWDHTMPDQEAEAAVADATDSEDAYWDFKGNQEVEAEKNKHDIGDTTWFESLDNLVEDMEENEDMVECKECFDLFPKTDCIKLAFGYICPHCNKSAEVADDDVFKIEFPEYEKFRDTEDEFDDSKLAMSDEDVVRVNEPFEEPFSSDDPVKTEGEPELTAEEAVPFLVNDEVEAVAGYEKAAEVVTDSDLENKEEILNIIDHIKEEEEEHIEELQDLIPEEKNDEVVEVENDPISDNSVDTAETLVEDIADDELEAEIEKAKKTLELAKLNAKIEKQKTKSSKQVAKQAKSELSATKSANKATKDTSNTNVAISNDKVKVSKNDVKVSKNDLKKTKVDNKQQELQRKQTSEKPEEAEVEEVTETKYWLCKYDNNNITILSAPTEEEAEEKFKANYKDRYTFNACEWGVTEVTEEEAAEYSDNQVTEGIGGNVVAGAATGASLGSLLGPSGGVAGAALGAVGGLVKSLFSAADSLTKKLSDKSKIKKALESDPELKETIEKIKEETGEANTEKILTWIEDYYKQKAFNTTGDAFDEFSDEAKEVEETAIDVDEESGGEDFVNSSNVEIWGIESLADSVYNATLIKSYENFDHFQLQDVVDEMYEIDGLFTFIDDKDGNPELYAWNTKIWNSLGNCEIAFEDPIYDAALEKVFNKTNSLEEHINNRAEPIESDQELEGTDNAVVKCKVADVVTHSEDEKPVNCEGKKEPLEKPLTEKLDVTNGYPHIKSVATTVHKAVDNYTKDNKVATRTDGTSFYVLGDKTNSDPEKMKKIILDTLANDGYDPEVVQYVEKGNLYGYVIDKIRMTSRMTLSYKNESQIKESLYNFTEEEMAEYNMDEDGVSLDSYDEYVRCNWCGEVFTVDQCIFEANMGWLCDRCEAAIRSRGEKLTILTNPTDDEIISTLTEAKKMTRDEMIAKEGTDDVDLVNAGREEEDRVEIVD